MLIPLLYVPLLRPNWTMPRSSSAMVTRTSCMGRVQNLAKRVRRDRMAGVAVSQASHTTWPM